MRLNPDQLLTVINKQQSREGQGKLKIYLGMVAGVGKTYAMLSHGHELKEQGTEVVVGIVETHGREETQELIAGLDIFPRKKIEYRDVVLEEMDIDGLIQRKPQVVLVDELAHTNAPGSRHKKRYQDVLDLLENGIDVSTTLNVQHIESRAYTVAEVAGVVVQETVPDSIIDRADELVLIDIAPEALMKRLREGKIYPEERIQRASQNFFQQGNLTALRELALRLVAEKVDHDLRDFKLVHGIPDVWKTSHRLMVAVFASPHSENLIRWTRRLAYGMGASWVGAFVETDRELSRDEEQLLAKNLALVTQLGGEVITTKDEDAVSGLLRIANQNQVTQVIVGKSKKNAARDFFFFDRSPVSRLIRESGDIDIYVVGASKELSEIKKTYPRRRSDFKLGELYWIIGGLFFVTAMCLALQPWVGYREVGMIYLLALNLGSFLFFSRLAIIIAAFLSALSWTFIFIPPMFDFSVTKLNDWMMLVIYFVAAVAIGGLTKRLKIKETFLAEREERATALYHLTRKISMARNLGEVVTGSIEEMQNVFDGQVGLFMMEKGSEQRLDPKIYGDMVYNEKEFSVASWVAQYGKPAGRFTDTLPSAKAMYLPVKAGNDVLGVIGFEPKENQRILFDQQETLENFVRQLALGMEREELNDSLRKKELSEESDRIYSTLLNSVSNELKEPLSKISSSAQALRDEKLLSSPEAVSKVSEDIIKGSTRMMTLVQNLLDMSRLESHKVQLQREEIDIKDLISDSLSRLEAFTRNRKINIELAEDLPKLNVDFPLIEQALRNVIQNACSYTPKGETIDISAAYHADLRRVEIQVRDYGSGLPKHNPSQVFEKFFRADGAKPGGTGLGLSVSKGLIELHGGEISAKNADDRGAIFVITLPA
ncbi:MAG: ATP-binding protein [Pseudobdellovibrionaceae bacterium]